MINESLLEQRLKLSLILGALVCQYLSRGTKPGNDIKERTSCASGGLSCLPWVQAQHAW